MYIHKIYFFDFVFIVFLIVHFFPPKTDVRIDITCRYLSIHQPLYVIHTNQSWRITSENAFYTRLECKKAYSNAAVVYSKCPPKWAKVQDFWAKLGFWEWMKTIVKKCTWHKYKLNQKLPSCMLLRKKNYYNPMTQCSNIYYQKTSEIAISSPFLQTLFFLFFAKSRQMFIRFHNFSD